MSDTAIIVTPQIQTLETESESIVVSAQNAVEVVTAGIQGPPGAAPEIPGSQNEVLFNRDKALAADENFRYDPTAQSLVVGVSPEFELPSTAAQTLSGNANMFALQLMNPMDSDFCIHMLDTSGEAYGHIGKKEIYLPQANATFAGLLADSLHVKMGDSSSNARPGGAVKDFASSLANSGTSETNLFLHTIPGSTFSATGAKVEGYVALNYAATANNKRIRIYFGSTVIYDSQNQAINSGTGLVTFRVMATGSVTARAACTWNASVTLKADCSQVDVGSLDFASGIVIKVTGQGGASGDITAKLGSIQYIPAA